MRACATVSGAVMFIPDPLETKPQTNSKAISYKNLTPKTKPSALDRLEKVARKIAKLKKAA